VSPPVSARHSCLFTDVSGPDLTSRQSNTHSTESRELLYPWHPWYGRSLWIHGALVKSGSVVYRCSLEAQQEAPLLEIPQWMFESTGCCRVHHAENPFVDCAALLDLKLLFHCTRSPVSGLVVQAQHYSVPGGADARIGESTQSSTDRIVSLPPQSPAWPQLPREIRQQTMELLAQLLREHYRRILSGQLGKEGENE
jgi:hypothetical protein